MPDIYRYVHSQAAVLRACHPYMLPNISHTSVYQHVPPLVFGLKFFLLE
jgi:hypothetical protein